MEKNISTLIFWKNPNNIKLSWVEEIFFNGGVWRTRDGRENFSVGKQVSFGYVTQKLKRAENLGCIVKEVSNNDAHDVVQEWRLNLALPR